MYNKENLWNYAEYSPAYGTWFASFTTPFILAAPTHIWGVSRSSPDLDEIFLEGILNKKDYMNLGRILKNNIKF